MNDRIIWDRLIKAIPNPYGVAGLMGNLQAESGLNPQNMENSYEKKLGFNDSTYTNAVNNGTYSNFCTDRCGYGLAQWTSQGRKQNLYQFAKSKGKSIDDLEMQIDFLIQELKTSYSLVYRTLVNAKSIQEASDIVLTRFEIPADQSQKVKNYRASLGQVIFKNFASDIEKKIEYFPKYEETITSVLNSMKIDSSYAYREKIARANGMSNYSGTREQNINMLDLIKQGKLIKP